MAANKRYIIQVGDTVRIDRKKCTKFDLATKTKNYIKTCMNYPTNKWSPAMLESIGKEVCVAGMTDKWILSDTSWNYPLEVCTKVMPK